MKKIMKKALCLVLALALTIVPMTVTAATSANLTEFAPTSTETLYSINYERAAGSVNCYDDAYVYNWTPTVDGVLTLTAVSNDVWIPISNTSNGFDACELSANTDRTINYNVSANTTYKIEVMTWSENPGTVEFKASFTEGSGSAIAGSGSMQDPYIVSGVEEIPGLDYGQTAYYQVAADPTKKYDLQVRGAGMMDYFSVAAQFGSSNDSMMGTAKVENITPYPLGAIIFSITNNNRGSSGPYTYQLTEAVISTLGTENDPDILVLDSIVTSTITGTTYYYEYEATQAGTLSVNMYDNLCSNGWICSISGGANEASFVKSSYDPLTNPVEYVVAAGETIKVWVATVDYQPGQVYFMATFNAGSGTPGGGNAGGGNIGGGDEVNYGTGVALELGTYEYAADATYTYTVYEFSPTETGKYTFSSTDSKIGIVSNNGMWITVGSSTTEIDATSVNATQVSWDCTDVGQSIWLAAMPDTNVATITVSRSNLETSDEVAWTIYKNTITPTTYKYDGDVNKLLNTYVDTSDNVVDKAVLGKDGYYHLNSEDGEILYVNLNDALMSLATMATKGKVSAVYYNNDNEVTEKIDFTAALLEYLGVKDIAELEALNLGTNPVIYPLTADLMAMFQKVGDRNGWYGEGGFIANTLADDAWMFATYYVKGQTTSSVPAPGVTSTSPSTGDHASIVVWAIVMVVAAGAAFVVAESKKRAR